ncbi:MAG: nickel pincer cofactor biosynthesis protein LarC [Firmicutes bacterium]|nr:nickel pincer cofactor biosynthesis protein LarC [Bacillota bacterium]
MRPSASRRETYKGFAQLMWAYLDCFSGVSGNMFLGALLDAGVPAAVFQDVIASMGLENVKIKSAVVTKHGIAGCYVEVRHPEQHVHRHLQDIIDIIEGAGFEPAVSKKAIEAFRRLAEAEAEAHGTTIDKVHFHEVGAIDAIVDVVCTVAGFHYLGVTEIQASPVQLGTGFIKVAHGMMPVPVPATMNLLKGVPSYSRGIEAELATPTGAALLTSLASSYGPLPAGRILEVGYGAGTRELPIPNLLRLVLIEPADGDRSLWSMDEVALLECNLDDHNPETIPPLISKLLDAGAWDAYVQDVTMKGGRPGIILTVLCPPGIQTELAELIFRETTTLGIRTDRKLRYILPRESLTVSVADQKVSVKVARLGEEVITVAPEYRDCLRASEAAGLPLKEIYDRAKIAARTALGVH